MNRRILAVDDNPTNLRLASTVLELEGYEVHEASDAEEAAAALREWVPDLILMDLSLPGMDGLALTRTLKADVRLQNVPIVAVTARTLKSDQEQAQQAGCCGYITKPIDPVNFTRQIAAYLGGESPMHTVLVVDDHPINRKLLRAQLEAEGCSVLEAADGVDALQLLQRESVDGVISDILMPRMDGYRLCLEMRQSEHFAAVPCVLYTGTYNSDADRALALSAGADDFICKPASIQQVLAALRKAAGRPRVPAAAAGSSPAFEKPVLKQYSETLVRKLEQKSGELERAYSSLARTEARLAGIVESALEAILAVDDSHSIVLFNPAAERMFGWQRKDALTAPLSRFIPELLSPGAAEPRAGTHTVWGIRRDGSKFPVEASVSGIDTAQGSLSTVFLRDITDRHEAEQALARSEAALRQAEEIAKLAHITSDAAGELHNCSDSLALMLGISREQLPRTNRQWLALIHADDRRKVKVCAIAAAQRPVRTAVEYRFQHSSGAWLHIHHVMEPLPLQPGQDACQLRWFNTLQDVTAAKHAELRIRRLNRVLSVLSGINSLIVRATDRDELLRESCRIAVEAGQFPKAWIGLVSEGCDELELAASCGVNAHFLVEMRAMLQEKPLSGTDVLATTIREARPAVWNDLRNAPALATTPLVYTSLETQSRAIAFLPLIIDGKGIGLMVLHAELAGFFDQDELAVLQDLTSDISFCLDHLRKAAQIDFLAHYDSLTQLPNRVLFTERVAQALDANAGRSGMQAVLLIDLVRFRRINQAFGRASGDALLRLTAQRLGELPGTVARVGVDVFALLLTDLRGLSDVARLAERTCERCFGLPFPIAGEDLRIGCQAGIAVSPDDGSDAESLLRNAEAALRRAKLTSEQIVFYAPDHNARAAEALNIESKLRRAIERQEFVLHYQPKVRLPDGKIMGLEALIRWRDAEWGLVPPARFIPVLEESGLIGSVGQWALQQALKDQASWRAAGCRPPRVAVNVSPLQLLKPDFAESLARLMAGYERPELELEITESMIMEHIDSNILTLQQIRASGVHVAVDDFGTGYCSLAYIARLPVTSLKIDRSFVTGMAESPEGLAIVSSIIALAHALKLQVIAEGVETEEQARLLHLLACDEAQGFLYSRPVPYQAIEELLLSGSSLAPLPH
jgi:diguanylate cyclase (GGDEF)-like protein/PAS domain S-box-containing protein